jgi:hypothetical protein
MKPAVKIQQQRRSAHAAARVARWRCPPERGDVARGEALVGSVEAIAAGAVLAVISISIVPYAFSEVSRLVATVTVLGFVGGYLLS